MFEIIAKGGIVMAPLMLCSIISITIIIERAIFWMKQKQGINPTQLLQMAEEGKFDEIIKGGKIAVLPLHGLSSAALCITIPPRALPWRQRPCMRLRG